MKIIEIVPLSKSVRKTIKIPGSKSYTNRAFFIAAMNKSKVKIINPLLSEDTKAMINCLRKLGVVILKKENFLEVRSSIFNISNRQYELNAHLSGLTIRFLLALSTIIPGTKILSGEEGLNKRPIGELVNALVDLGAKIQYLERTGYPPLKITSSQLTSNKVKIKGSVSSQYLSALLMIAPLLNGLTVEVIGEQTSKPFIEMTIDIMKHFEVNVLNEQFRKYIVSKDQRYISNSYTVENDVSSACYFLAIAALTKSIITIKNINPTSKQADMKFLKILQNMGNKISFGKNDLTIVGKGVKAMKVNMNDCPDQVQTLAILAAFAKGITKISGISNLKFKETDRLFALSEELKKMSIKSHKTKDTLTIYGGNPKPTKINTYNDHRMAMAFSVAGAKLPGIQIVDKDVVNKTFPTFWTLLNSIGIKVIDGKKNIVLIGMRGSGKTTTAQILSKRLNKPIVDTDDLIMKKTKLAIPKIVERYGWDYFRKKETEIVSEISLENNRIISTGGGIILNAYNVLQLKQNGIFIFLNASSKTLLKRVGDDNNRPFLTNSSNRQQEIERLLKERQSLYRAAASKIINVDKLKPTQVADKIILECKGEI